MLVNNQGAKVYSSIFDIANGKSVGKFQLPGNIEQGMYRLMGFTLNNQTSTCNKVYNRNKHLKDVDFLNAILEDLQINFEIPEERRRVR